MGRVTPPLFFEVILKIAIVGGSPSSEHLAPFDNPDWEIWVLAIRHDHYSRYDRIFEVHADAELLRLGQEHLRRLALTGKPVIAGTQFAENVVLFPFDQADALIGRRYLTSSAAYMMAYAILHIRSKGDAENEIGIFGIDMSVDDNEYFHQQPCMNAWIGLAIGMGIKVSIPEQSSLLKASYTYGQSSPECKGPFTPSDFDELREQHLNVIEGLKQEIRERESKIHAHSGAAEAYSRMSKVARALENGQDIKRLKDTAILKR